MHVILNGVPLEEVDCFKYLGSQVAAGGGCERDVVHIIIIIIIILLKQYYNIQLTNNKIQMAWLTSWLVVG